MTAYMNLSGEFAYLSIYLMKRQRGYRFSLLSQVLLFRIITTVQIYVGRIGSLLKYPRSARKGPGKCKAVPSTARSNSTTSVTFVSQHMSKMD